MKKARFYYWVLFKILAMEKKKMCNSDYINIYDWTLWLKFDERSVFWSNQKKKRKINKTWSF